jgi:hypothetical protein
MREFALNRCRLYVVDARRKPCRVGAVIKPRMVDQASEDPRKLLPKGEKSSRISALWQLI